MTDIKWDTSEKLTGMEGGNHGYVVKALHSRDVWGVVGCLRGRWHYKRSRAGEWSLPVESEEAAMYEVTHPF